MNTVPTELVWPVRVCMHALVRISHTCTNKGEARGKAVSVGLVDVGNDVSQTRGCISVSRLLVSSASGKGELVSEEGKG